VRCKRCAPRCRVSTLRKGLRLNVLDRLLEAVLFVAGLAFGSFLNVCISRIPRDQSILHPPSHCEACSSPIRWYDNVPLVSWMVLRSRCRYCRTRISARYPAVELLTALLFTTCYLSFGWTLLTLKFCVFGFLLIGLIFMDAETGLLPREFTYPGIALGLVFSWIVPTDYSATALVLRMFDKMVQNVHWLSLLDSALGGLVGAGFFYLTWAFYYLVRKKHGLGFGDITLMGMSGAFLGVKLILLVIFCSPLLAVVYVCILLVREIFVSRAKRETQLPDEGPFLSRQIPFGVFLGVCSLAAMFLGQSLWSWYLGRL
jgi:leader peptidase (prepilin peptidase) / N-methyltransferase